ncbi:hypothetical protein [Streptomyces iconiensis]|uniref:Lipoprotein n=1 Tax=Streptomyces iconiensis TaxID=1384038 RepID=A0ABT6ZRX9_9ACTN|nr:hypothetical protein [Streptomyces iconiensis]MDJ1131827.1 hypothetical protein [Streptomyces iconiensis]
MRAPQTGGLFRRWYGESPWQCALLVASFVLTGYAGVRLLDGDTLGVLVWFVGAALLHDLVLLPLYSLADRLPRLAGPYVNYLRVPAVLSALLLLVWFPLISGPPARYEGATGLPGGGGFALRWLLISAALFALSGLLLFTSRARLRRASARARHRSRSGGREVV